MIPPPVSLAELGQAYKDHNAETVLRAMHDLLWDPIDPGAQWDSSTVEYVAQMVDAYYPGRCEEKRAAADALDYDTGL